MSGTPTPRPEARGRLARTRCGGYTTTPWATAAAPRWRRHLQVMSCVLRHTPSGKRHASCGGFARAYGLEADWRPAERERRRRQRQTQRDYSPHKMTAPGRQVTTSSRRPLVQQPGRPCRALRISPGPLPAQAHLHGRTTGRCPAQLSSKKIRYLGNGTVREHYQITR
jgi:hypothetical protein